MWQSMQCGSRRGNQSPSTPIHVVPTLVAVALMLSLPACDSNRASVVESSTLPEFRGLATLRLGSCSEERVDAGQAPDRAECGRLAVAENPELPEVRHIDLNIVRLPAIASSPKPDPLFVLSGGPGEAATDLVDRLAPLFRDANRERDLVFVDQRGTGQSNPLDCAPTKPMDYSLSAQESLAMQHALLRECLTGYDADLRFYTTPYAMDDINRVREALGYDDINLWGGSYGTRAALVYMRRHPGTVRSAVLDSLAPIGINLPHHALADADRALRNLFALCEKQPACQQRFGDLESTTRQLIADLDERPRHLSVEHPLTQEDLQLSVSGQWLAGLIRLALYQRDLGPILPLAIESADAGDFRPFVLLMTLAEDLSESISIGMQATVLCAEDVTRPAPEDNDERPSILQLDAVSGMQATCAFWPRGELPDNYFRPVYSEAPVLLLSGELDPVTPPRWAAYAAETLPNSRHIRVPGAHHVSSNTGCVNDLIIEFLDTGSVADLKVECVNAIKPFPPFVSRAGPAMSYSGGNRDD